MSRQQRIQRADSSMSGGLNGSSKNINAVSPPQLWIAVGSTNPVKIQAVQTCFEEIFPQGTSVIVFAYDVPSGVADQPIGDDETKKGAKNRARAALSSAEADSLSVDFAVGLEGGILLREADADGSTERDGTAGGGNVGPQEMWCMAWMAIVGKNSRKCTLCRSPDASSSYVPPNKSDEEESQIVPTEWGTARTSEFRLPPQLSSLVLEGGMELGKADDMLFERSNSKQRGGTVGLMTNGGIDRKEYYLHALKLAVIPWIRPDLYMRANTTR